MKERTSFRQFYEELLESGTSEVLWSWHDPAHALLDPLRIYGDWDTHTRTYHHGYNTTDKEMLEDLWSLYAFSRVNDVLLLPYQTGTYDGTQWPGPAISHEQRIAFLTALGLERIDQPDFHPFYHEIVIVDQADDPASPVTVVDELWPGFMLGHLLICRAGVHIRAGKDLILKDIAEGSTLYWTFRRKNRPYEDLSHGWGHNSQWRTEFRRDYTDGQHFVYNADGILDARRPDSRPHPNPSREGLTADERVELLINRCFVRTTKPHHDLFPYDDTLVV